MNKSGLPCLTLAQKCKCVVASDGCGLRLGCALGMGRAQRQEGPSSFADQSEHAVLKNLHPRSSLGSMESCSWLFQWVIRAESAKGKGVWGGVWGKPGTSFQEASPWAGGVVTQNMLPRTAARSHPWPGSRSGVARVN